jgi:hypothetical protein
MACFQNLIMKENGSFQVRAEGSTRGRVELRPRAGALPKPFENTPWKTYFAALRENKIRFNLRA